MLGGSIRLFRIRGIQLSAHSTFVLLVGFVTWEGWREAGGAGALSSMLTVVVFFTCVVLHELGHAFTARRFGVIVPRILLLPIGGMAEFNSLPRKPEQEILISLAGPAVNFFIILILLIFTDVPSWAEFRNLEVNDLQLVLLMNLVMGCFNLLPVFPMDGGRVFRALLARRLSYIEATRWAVRVGKLLGFIGIVLMISLPENPHVLGALLFGFIIVGGELELRAIMRQGRSGPLAQGTDSYYPPSDHL